jgi:hypothetical protein
LPLERVVGKIDVRGPRTDEFIPWDLRTSDIGSRGSSDSCRTVTAKWNIRTGSNTDTVDPNAGRSLVLGRSGEQSNGVGNA